MKKSYWTVWKTIIFFVNHHLRQTENFPKTFPHHTITINCFPLYAYRFFHHEIIFFFSRQFPNDAYIYNKILLSKFYGFPTIGSLYVKRRWREKNIVKEKKTNSTGKITVTDRFR